MEKPIENFPGSPKYDAKHWATIGGIQSSSNLSKWNIKLPMMLKSGLEFVYENPSIAQNYNFKNKIHLLFLKEESQKTKMIILDLASILAR